MTQEKQRHTFISYSRVNKQFALKLARELKAAGFPVWLDLLDIPTGARWDDEIETALRECGIFMTILTPASIISENAKDEIGYAIDHGKRILPVLLENCEVPLRLRRFQYVDFTSMNYDQGVRTAKELLSRLMKEPIAESVTVSKERPTRPSIPDAYKAIPAEPPASSKKQTSTRPIALYAGISVVVLLALLVGASLIIRGLSSAAQSPTTTSTQETEPSPVSSSTAIADTSTPEPQSFYVEEFDGSLDHWRFFRKSGKRDDEFSYIQNDGKLALSIHPSQDQPWAHLINDSFTYGDVQLEAVVTNKGNNGNGVSLICRHSDKGWIEFTVSNNQSYSIYVYDASGEALQGGPAGSGKIPAGKGTNVYTATCKGNELSLAVNGNPIHTIETNRGLPEGNIGIGFSAPINVPIDVDIESLKVSQP